MKRKQLAEIRRHLGKTQSQMAQILGVSPKAVQSFEQGWRNFLKSGKHTTVTGCLHCPGGRGLLWMNRRVMRPPVLSTIRH